MAINYTRCINQANKLETMAYEYQRLYNSLNSMADNSASYWQGEANEAFRAEMAEWKKEAVSIKEEMESLSYLIKRVARQIRAEEMRD